MTTNHIELKINGKTVSGDIEPRMLLSDFIRENAGLTGTHVGCEHGVCGACTVQIDGVSARSCLTLAVQCEGQEICTVESLGNQDEMHPLQEAFWEKHGLQCGFCTPGMLLTAEELLRANPSPTRDEIAEVISGNLCRCTGYQTIIDAIEHASVIIREGKSEVSQ